MRISIIAALSHSYAIGINNQLPWHLSSDLRRFKQLTLGKPIIMGRKTYESIGCALPDRKNIVVTKTKTLDDPSIVSAESLEHALLLAKGAMEVMIIGGAQIYELALPKADRLFLTWVDGDFEADTFFPKFNMNEWKLVERKAQPKSASNPISLTFCEYERL